MKTDDSGITVIYVTEMCAYVYRRGDIDLRLGGGSKTKKTVSDDQLTMDGNTAHRLLQAQAHYGKIDAGSYNSEVPLSAELSLGGRRCRIDGRADGVYFDGTFFTVEEIKSAPRSPEAMAREPEEAHLAQAAIYAYILSQTRGVKDGVNVCMKYVNSKNGESECVTRAYTTRELRVIFEYTVGAFAFMAEYFSSAFSRLAADIVAAKFPHPSIRRGQREFMLEVMRVVREKRRLIAQAPTGTGKTMAVVYPALKSVAAGRGGKLFYLTAKNLTGKAALDAAELILSKLPEAESGLMCVMITSRTKCCIRSEKPAKNGAFDLGEPVYQGGGQTGEGGFRSGKSAYAEFYSGQHCNPADCDCADGHFSRVNAALEDILKHERILTAENAAVYAVKHRVCPYELTLDASMYAPFVICDLNYLFDPRVRLRRYFGDDAGGDYIFLIDEAHNLPDRARDIFSMELSDRHFNELADFIGDGGETVRFAANELARRIAGYAAMCGESETVGADGEKTGFAVEREQPPGLKDAVEAFIARCDDALRVGFNPKGMADVYFDMRKLSELLALYDGKFRTVYRVGGGETSVRVMCVDPSELLDAAMRKGRSSVLFSATMTPLDYFRDILGCGRIGGRDCGGDIVEVPSPFERENLCVIAHPNTSVRYSMRDENASVVAELLHAMASGKRGNYIAFMPSFDYLEKVAAAYSAKYPGDELVVQSRGMGERRRREFLEAFDRLRDGGAKLGFAVLGGMFSEGIDLRGNRLIGVAVVGVGIPLITPERNIVAEYFEETREDGYAYAYVYPGMTKVLQAAGRVIRTATDRGVVLLIDDRYATPEYKRLYPDAWRGMYLAENAREVGAVLKKFWNGG